MVLSLPIIKEAIHLINTVEEIPHRSGEKCQETDERCTAKCLALFFVMFCGILVIFMLNLSLTCNPLTVYSMCDTVVLLIRRIMWVSAKLILINASFYCIYSNAMLL